MKLNNEISATQNNLRNDHFALVKLGRQKAGGGQRQGSFFLFLRYHLTTIMSDSLTLKGVLRGHSGWVNSIATTTENNDMILSASRGTSTTHAAPCPANPLNQCN
jgi:hypothetical protein